MSEPGFVQHVRRIAADEPMFVDVVSVQLFVEDRDALQAQLRLEVVHCGEFQARVEVLAAALTEITNYVSRHHRNLPEDVEPLLGTARAALAAGETESEASDG
jgi:hypothetical protein